MAPIWVTIALLAAAFTGESVPAATLNEYKNGVDEVARVVRLSPDSRVVQDLLNLPILKPLLAPPYKIEILFISLDAESIRHEWNQFRRGEDVIYETADEGESATRVVSQGNTYEFAKMIFAKRPMFRFGHPPDHQSEFQTLRIPDVRIKAGFPRPLALPVRRLWRAILFEELFHFLEHQSRIEHQSYLVDEVDAYVKLKKIPVDHLPIHHHLEWNSDLLLSNEDWEFADELSIISELSVFFAFQARFRDWLNVVQFNRLIIGNHDLVRNPRSRLLRAVCEFNLETATRDQNKSVVSKD